MTLPTNSSDRLLSIYLAISQYPILADRIRMAMRRELFERSILDPKQFEAEVKEKAVQSQKREGLDDPFSEEPTERWEFRMTAVRNQLTEYYFSHHLSLELFERLIGEVLGERGISQQELLLSINPELAPQDLLFEQAIMIEHLPADERARLEPRLQEIKVVLIRNMISDQLPYINIAKEWFTVADLADIRQRKIGRGRIGGKAAGMLLAARILREVADSDLLEHMVIPESYFLGSDQLYTFMAMNNLVHWNDQKYKDSDQMHAEFPDIQRDFLAGEFPPEILERLQTLLATVGRQPLIVRSSSLLEDNFGTSFAGKYESIFVPNQAGIKENLAALTQAIAQVYASTLNPGALLYRRSRGLQDYDERMAILIQVVQGETFEGYLLPHAAGVAFSRNQFRWSPQIRGEDGFVRLVWGLGTRAVDRVGNDYPRLVALSHPLLRPSAAAKAIRRYSQQYVDLIDLNDNAFKTLPIHDVLNSRYPPLRYLVEIDQEGFFSPLRSNIIEGDPHQMILTMEELLRRTPFAARLREMLKTLEKYYHGPVDMEFTAEVLNPQAARPEVEIAIIQCRPQSYLQEMEEVIIPANLPLDDMIFSTDFMVPEGKVSGIRYVLFVAPEGYFALKDQNARAELRRAISRLNQSLTGEPYISVGPGRWGTTNPDLGVDIDYADIYNTRALVELAGQGIGPAPEPSLGTHFFQDLLEGQIFPLAIMLDSPDAIFNRPFFYQTPSHLLEHAPQAGALEGCLRLIDVEDFRPGCRIRLVMDSEKNRGVAYMEGPGCRHTGVDL